MYICLHAETTLCPCHVTSPLLASFILTFPSRMMYVCNLNQMQNKHHHWDISYRDKEVCERVSVTLWSSRFDCLAPKRLLRSPSNVTLLTAFFFLKK